MHKHKVKTDIYSKIEVLIGLKLFDSNQLTSSEKKLYKDFLNNEIDSPDDVHKLIKWYHEFMPKPIKTISKRVKNYLSIASRIILILFFIIGLSAAGVLFKYDGSAPINTLPILVVFVLIPLTFLLASLIFPYLNKEGTSFMTPFFNWIEGQVEKYFLKHNSNSKQELKYNLEEFHLDFIEPIIYLFRKNYQKAAFGYVVGALLWMIVNVTTTDLAFSWSSTLEFKEDKIHQITSFMSTPWARIIPSATVDLKVVKMTRYYRADSSNIMDSSSGQWWSFIFMSMVFYNLIPRSLFYFYYRWRFIKSLNESLCVTDTGYTILSLADDSIIVKSSDKPNFEIYPESDVASSSHKTDYITLLLWNLSNLNEGLIPKKLNRKVISIHKIGGLDSTKNDKNIIEQIAKESATHSNANIVVFVKIWESPNLRLENILTKLVSINSKSRINIIPLFEEENQLNPANKKNWSSRIVSLNKQHGKKRIFFGFDDSIELKELV